MRLLSWPIALALVELLANPALSQIAGQQPPNQIQKEIALGRQRGAELEQKDGIFGDAAVLAYVQRLENRLARAEGGAALEIRITRGSEVYAALLPSGVLYISGALFARIESEAELAGLLAHQSAHAHRTPAPSQDQTTNAFIWPACVLASPDAAPVKGTEDRRQAEVQATQAAIQTLKKAGYDPSAVLDLLSKLAYEHPAWAKAIVPEDLLSLRTDLEADSVPQTGYLTDSSEFEKQHAKLVAALGHGVIPTTPPSLTSPVR